METQSSEVAVFEVFNSIEEHLLRELLLLTMAIKLLLFDDLAHFFRHVEIHFKYKIIAIPLNVMFMYL